MNFLFISSFSLRAEFFSSSICFNLIDKLLIFCKLLLFNNNCSCFILCVLSFELFKLNSNSFIFEFFSFIIFSFSDIFSSFSFIAFFKSSNSFSKSILFVLFFSISFSFIFILFFKPLFSFSKSFIFKDKLFVFENNSFI